MVLNRVWMGMFVISLIMGFSKLIFWQDVNILQTMMDALFAAAKTGFELALFMTGTMALWMGFMRIGQDGGAIGFMSRAISPLFSQLFPDVPKNHPAVGAGIHQRQGDHSVDGVRGADGVHNQEAGRMGGLGRLCRL